MIRRLTVLVASALLVWPSARTGIAQTQDLQTEGQLEAHGLAIERIAPDHVVILAGGVAIDGDARLAKSLAEGGATIREIVVLERMPPVYVVTYDDGEVRHYRSRRTAP